MSRKPRPGITYHKPSAAGLTQRYAETVVQQLLAPHEGMASGGGCGGAPTARPLRLCDACLSDGVYAVGPVSPRREVRVYGCALHANDLCRAGEEMWRPLS